MSDQSFEEHIQQMQGYLLSLHLKMNLLHKWVKD